MATVAPHNLQRIGLLFVLVVGGLLIAHAINAFVADALYVIPDDPAQPTRAAQSAPLFASYSPTQAVEDVRSSGLFLLPPPTESGSPNGTRSDRRGSGGPVVRASLGLAARIRLIGIVLSDQRGGLAIVEELASKQQALYHLHDSVLDLGEVAEIRRNGIVVRQGNVEEVLELAISESLNAMGGAPAASPPPSAASSATGAPLRKVVDRREVEQAMNDLPKLLSQARAVPNTVNGAVNGFRLDYIAPASFYEKIGVQTGDVLQRVNGVDIRDPSTMLTLLQQLKNEQIVKLDVMRNNQRSTITYELR